MQGAYEVWGADGLMHEEFRKNRRRMIFLDVGLCVLLVILFFVSMCVGRYAVSLSDIWRFFTGRHIPDISKRIIVYLRIPRTLIALLIGAALSVSGAIYQSAFNNKLVSPDLLGVSSGASVGACIAILLSMSSIIISLFAFLFGLLAVAITLLVAKTIKSRSNIVLLLSGIAVGGLMSSLIGLIKYLADNDMKLAEMTYWLLGDISGTTINDFYVFLPIVVVGCVVAFIFSWRLNIVSLGAKEAKSLGVNYGVTMSVFILIATVMTAGSVAIGGTIGWIGLVIPNIVRLLLGSDNRKVLPVSMLGGACFMIVVDMLARTLAPNEIPLSVITGILGTPLFIISIVKRRKDLK